MTFQQIYNQVKEHFAPPDSMHDPIAREEFEDMPIEQQCYIHLLHNGYFDADGVWHPYLDDTPESLSFLDHHLHYVSKHPNDWILFSGEAQIKSGVRLNIYQARALNPKYHVAGCKVEMLTTTDDEDGIRFNPHQIKIGCNGLWVGGDGTFIEYQQSTLYADPPLQLSELPEHTAFLQDHQGEYQLQDKCYLYKKGEKEIYEYKPDVCV